jgi:hypothetical protein
MAGKGGTKTIGMKTMLPAVKKSGGARAFKGSAMKGACKK